MEYDHDTLIYMIYLFKLRLLTPSMMNISRIKHKHLLHMTSKERQRGWRERNKRESVSRERRVRGEVASVGRLQIRNLSTFVLLFTLGLSSILWTSSFQAQKTKLPLDLLHWHLRGQTRPHPMIDFHHEVKLDHWSTINPRLSLNIN